MANWGGGGDSQSSQIVLQEIDHAHGELYDFFVLNSCQSLKNNYRTFITTKRSDFSNRQEQSLFHSNYIHACIRMTNFSFICTPPSNYMHKYIR